MKRKKMKSKNKLTEREVIKRINKLYKNCKITIRLERGGKYVEQNLTPSIICSLFDLQFMMQNTSFFEEEYIDSFIDFIKKKPKKVKKIISGLKKLKKAVNKLANATWDTLRLNNCEKDILQFFRTIEYIDDAMHGSQLGRYNLKTKKMVWEEKILKDYPKWSLGKPKWRKIK